MKDVTIVNQLNSKYVDQLYELLTQMWWATTRTKEELMTTLKNCLSFALIENSSDNLIGYARVLTDEIKYAYIFDVMLVEQNRKNGFAKMLMQNMITHPKLKNITCFELTCVPELVGFYEQFGFSKSYGNVVPMRYKKN